MQQNSFSYPAMLDLKNKKCVIIGGGKVAVRKALPLIEAGANLTVIAPAADPQLLTLAKTGLLQLELRAYADNDLIDAFVTIAATDDFHINRKIAVAAPYLCNVVTEPSLGNFSVPSTVKNGALTFTLSTGGMPALTRVLSQDLRAYYGSDFAEFNEFLQQLRRELKTIATTPEKRTAFWRQTLNQSVIGLLHRIERFVCCAGCAITTTSTKQFYFQPATVLNFIWCWKILLPDYILSVLCCAIWQANNINPTISII